MRKVRQCTALGTIATALAFTASGWFAATASADLRVPDALNKPAAAKPQIVVERTLNQSGSQLIIPRKFLPDAKVGAAPWSTQTIVAGTALSLGAALCGLVLLRRRGVGNLPMTAAVVLGIGLTGGAIVVANAPYIPPKSVVIIDGHDVSVSVIDQGDKIVLKLDDNVTIHDRRPGFPPR